MADDKKLSELSTAATLTGAELVEVVQSSDNFRTTSASIIAQPTHSAASKATPVDADEFPLVDSAASNVLKKLTWANVKATAKTYFDTLYAVTSGTLAQFAATTSAQLAGVISDETGSGALVFGTSPTLTTPTLGVATATSINKVTLTAPATSATLTVADGKTLTASNSLTLAGTDSTTMTFPPASASIGYLNIPQNSQSAGYTTVLADAGKSVDHPSTDANARTFTIDSNANVPYPVGTVLSFSNMTSQVVTIAITSDTMYLAGSGTTGSRSLAQYGTATARKLTSTTWLISGVGLT